MDDIKVHCTVFQFITHNTSESNKLKNNFLLCQVFSNARLEPWNCQQSYCQSTGSLTYFIHKCVSRQFELSWAQLIITTTTVVTRSPSSITTHNFIGNSWIIDITFRRLTTVSLSSLHKDSATISLLPPHSCFSLSYNSLILFCTLQYLRWIAWYTY